MKTIILMALALATVFFYSSVLAATSQIYPEDVIFEAIEEDSWHYYQLELDNPAKLTIKLRKLSDDVDLYVSQNKKPTLDDFMCAPQKAGNLIETCRLTSNTTGKWFIGIHGKTYSEYQLGVNVRDLDLISQIGLN